MDAWRRVYPTRLAEAAERIAAFDVHLSDRCLGSISEIFDAEPPYQARGCIAQAWSVAEVLRCWAVLAE
jgi:glycogen debranching enzyme